MRERSDDTDTVSALAEALRLIAGTLKRRLGEQTQSGDLTLSQIAVLRRLDGDGPATVTSLARAEAMRPQSMGAIVARLQAAGLLSGEPDPTDGRQTILSLTPACRAVIAARRAVRQDWLVRQIKARLDPAERQELARAVRLIERLVEP